MNQEDVGITFKDLLKMIKKRIWIVLAVTLAVTIAVTCFVQFGYNASRRSYTVTYTLTTPALSSGIASLYIGDTQYKAEDFVGEEVLGQVKAAGGEAFASVDVAAIAKDGAVTVAQSSSQSEKNTAEITISIPSTYFSSSQQAEDFIGALAEYTGTYAVDLLKDANFGVHIEGYQNSRVHNTYEQKIDFLSEQQAEILRLYDVLIAAENEYFVVTYTNENEEKVSEMLQVYRFDAESVFDESAQEALLEELEACGYILDLEYYQQAADHRLSVLDGMIANVDRQLEQLDAMLVDETDEQLKTAIAEESAFLYLKKADYSAEKELINANKALSEEKNAENNKKFDEKLDSYKEQLQEQTDILQAVCVQYMADGTSVSVKNPASASGGVSVVLAVVGGLVIGLFCAVVLVYLLDAKKYRAEKEAALSAEGDGDAADFGAEGQNDAK